MNDYHGICRECGISANVLTCLKKYGKVPEKLAHSISTFSQGVCIVCNEKKEVTEVRDFFYPETDLIRQVAEFLHKPDAKV